MFKHDVCTLKYMLHFSCISYSYYMSGYTWNHHEMVIFGSTQKKYTKKIIKNWSERVNRKKELFYVIFKQSFWYNFYSGNIIIIPPFENITNLFSNCMHDKT